MLVPPPPPIVTVSPPPPPLVRTPTTVPSVRHWSLGAVQCGGVTVTPVRHDLPIPTPDMSAGAGTEPGEVALRFRIDAEGRPLSIARPVNAFLGDDTAPALAAWRFRPSARSDCEATLVRHRTALSEADPQILMRMMALGPPPRFGWGQDVLRALASRVAPPGGTCAGGPMPAPQVRAYPDFTNMRVQPGEIAHSFLWFDLDGKGRPANVRVAGTSGNADLDRESVRALTESRFAPEARTGCFVYFYRNPDRPLPAPDVPPKGAYRPLGATCPVEAPDGALVTGPTVFPEPFRRRQVEGWAVIGYDVAPWGATGNVRVLAAEPAAEFGERGLQIVRAGRRTDAGSGMTGCEVRVHFRMERPVNGAASHPDARAAATGWAAASPVPSPGGTTPPDRPRER